MPLTIVAPGVGGTGTTTGFNNFKNRIINGAMAIDQRNAGASVTQTTSVVYTVDRFFIAGSVTSKFTAQQNAGSVTPPVGFTNYLGCTSSSAYSVGAAENFNIVQRIEGTNVYDLGWGTANAKTVTLSFWVRSSLTGTFGGSLRNSAADRSYPFSYTISSANTWEYKTVTVAGDTTGTWLTTTGVGVQILFSMGAGSTLSGTAGAWASANYTNATGATSVVGTNGATFYITGVQLEVGESATGFDYRPYGTELALCQRYFELCDMPYIYMGGASFSDMYWNVPYKVTKRANATITTSTGLTYYSGGSSASFSPSLTSTTNALLITSTGLTTATGFPNQSNVLRASAEL